MPDNKQININSNLPVVKKSSSLRMWLTLVAVLLILAGLYYLNVYKKTSTPPPTVKVEEPKYAFSQTPYPQIPDGIVPEKDATVPQYWEGRVANLGVGGIFAIKKSLNQALVEYKAYLVKEGWTIINPANDAASVDFGVKNEQTNKTGFFQFRPDPNSPDSTIVMFSFNK